MSLHVCVWRERDGFKGKGENLIHLGIIVLVSFHFFVEGLTISLFVKFEQNTSTLTISNLLSKISKLESGFTSAYGS